MAVMVPLLHVLRGSAERALGRVRPPRTLKPGSGQWKAHLPAHARAKLVSPQAEAVPAPCSASESASHASQKALQNLLANVVEHAIFPVFRGLRPQARNVAQEGANARVRNMVRAAKGNLQRPGTSARIMRQAHRPVVHSKPKAQPDGTYDGVAIALPGLNLTISRAIPASNSLGFACGPIPVTDLFFTQAPLGLRAAADELEDKLRQYGRVEKKGKRYASPSRGAGQPSPTLKHLNIFRQGAEMRARANSTTSSVQGMLELMSPAEEDICSSCSSTPVSLDSEDDMALVWYSEPVERPWVVTTLNVPMSPDLITILAPSLEAEADDVVLSDIQGAASIHEAFQYFRLSVIVPLERALQDGHLSMLEPLNWGPNDLLQDVEDSGRLSLPYLPITFLNSTQEDVLDHLRCDVSPRLFRFLKDFVREQRILDDGGGEEQQRALIPYNRGLSGRSIDPPPSGIATPTEMMLSSGEDVGRLMDSYGPATLASMDLHSSPYLQEDEGDERAMPLAFPSDFHSDEACSYLQ